MPSDDVSKPGLFDRFATWVDRWTSKAWFFFFCVMLVIIWAPSFLIVPNMDTWQLIINTPTTVLTFLLVAVQQNAGQRDTNASQVKQNAIAKFLLSDGGEEEREELRQAIGLEDKEST